MWYIVSRIGVDTKAFYPIYVLQRNMNAKYVNYLEAQDIDFTGDNVILHAVWKLDQYKAWRNLPERLAKEARNFWIEFDADNHLDRLYQLDEPKNTARFFHKTFEPCNKFIWEQPLFYNPFARHVERLPLRCYHTQFEKPIKAIKDIEFFTCIDTDKNVAETLELFTELKKRNHSVCVMILNKERYEFYKDKLDYPIITNATKFTSNSIKRFENLMDRSKVYVDLTYRLTTGRAVYDAAFRGTYFVGTDTYGATGQLFPEYELSTYPVNLYQTLNRCLQARHEWTPENVLKKRDFFRNEMNIERLIEDLKERSE
ncbi:MAG: hypothetical protein ACW987_06965 [Candidatus Thorarchaeota archaeon]|jgi:hypothetical protein